MQPMQSEHACTGLTCNLHAGAPERLGSTCRISEVRRSIISREGRVWSLPRKGRALPWGASAHPGGASAHVLDMGDALVWARRR